ncbi:MAG: hypothetical protein WAW02_01505 [Sideroxyarcus sp.]
MKTIRATTFVSLLLCGIAAHAGTPSVSVTVSGEVAPGVYGEVQVGNAPPPVVYAQPVIIVPQPRHETGRPLYLHVPPGHARHWARHCHEYNACNRSVYFVKSAEYEPGYRDRKSKKRKDEGRRDERRDEGGNDDGKGRGRGNEDRRGGGRRD